MRMTPQALPPDKGASSEWPDAPSWRRRARLFAAVLSAAAALVSVPAARPRDVGNSRREPATPSQTLFFGAGNSRFDQSGIWFVSADGSDLRRLVAAALHPSWSPDGRLIAFASHAHWMVERSDGSGRYRVSLPISQDVSWTATGHQMLGYDEANATGDGSVIYSIDAGVRHAKRIVLQRTSDSVVDRVLASPTGSGYAYSTQNGDVWFVPTANRPVLLTRQPDRDSGMLAFSPDGETIAYGRLDGRIALIPVSHGRARLLDLSLTSVGRAAWSPDGRTLAVLGSDARSRAEIVLTSSAGARRRIHARGADDISWSPDGRSLAYISEGGLWVLDAATFARHRLTDADSGIAWQPPGSAKAAFESSPREAIVRPDRSAGHI